MAIIILGTMAFDAIETPFGKIDKIVGGSATYVAYAASHLISLFNKFPLLEMIFPKKKWMNLKSGVFN